MKKISKVSSFYLIKKIFSNINLRRKRQLSILFFVMLGSSLSETFLLGSIVPFIISFTNRIYGKSQESISNNLDVSIFTQNSNQSLLFYTLIFSLAVIICSITRLTNLWLNAKLAASIGSDLCETAYSNSLNQDYETHLNWNTNSLIATVTTEVGMVVEALNMLFQVLTSSLVTIGLIITLLNINFKASLICLITFGLAYFFVALLTKKKLSKNSRLFISLNENQFKSLSEGFGSIRDILLDRNQPYYVKNFSNKNRKMRTLQAENQFLTFFPRYALECLSLLILIILTLLLNNNSINNQNSLATLVAIALGSQRLLPALQQGYSGWAIFKASRDAIENVIKLLDLPVKNVPSGSDIDSPLNIKKYLELKDINYIYPNVKEEVITNGNLLIRKNDCIGLIGSSGSGKSTLIDIVAGLLSPIKGKVLIDGKININLQSFNGVKNNLRWKKNISHVPQSIFLADCSIKENIALGILKEKIDHKRLDRAIKLASLELFIKKLPQGLNTIVGERGVRLSGGQRQRIGIARALYKQSQFLILDEATSALDSITERKVIQSIMKDRENLTILLITHRLSTLKYCNKIFKINKGELVEILEDNYDLVDK